MNGVRMSESSCRLRSVVAGIVALVVSDCSLIVSDIPSPLREELTKDAQEVADNLSSGNLEKVTTKFTPQMTAALSSDRLASLWKSLETEKGRFVAQAGTRGSHIQGFDVIFVTCEFERGKVDLQVTYDKDRKIAGMYIR